MFHRRTHIKPHAGWVTTVYRAQPPAEVSEMVRAKAARPSGE